MHYSWRVQLTVRFEAKLKSSKSIGYLAAKRKFQNLTLTFSLFVSDRLPLLKTELRSACFKELSAEEAGDFSSPFVFQFCLLSVCLFVFLSSFVFLSVCVSSFLTLSLLPPSAKVFIAQRRLVCPFLRPPDLFRLHRSSHVAVSRRLPIFHSSIVITTQRSSQTALLSSNKSPLLLKMIFTSAS